MGKINILEKEIYNLIAAGEVVERPASIVKELVENAIDAGSNRIQISVQDGGLSLIEVSDNGCGIEHDDLEKAFLQHATSKLAFADDLNQIKTLGFRGEALCSIAAVSEVTLTTATEDGRGATIKVTGGEMEKITDAGCGKGTTVTVKNLFYNVPARKKFLKKPSGETAEISSLTQRLALANPDIAFKLTSNGNVILQSQGLGLSSAIFAVYGKDILQQSLPVDWQYKDMRVTGFVGKPELVKANRGYQTLMINGRYVKNNTISTAVQRAYQKHTVSGHFPFFVLNVEIPFSKVDVNVHPNKLDVRFSDNREVFMAVYTAVQTTLQPDAVEIIPAAKKNIDYEVIMPEEPESALKVGNVDELIRLSSQQLRTTSLKATRQDDLFDTTILSKPNYLASPEYENTQKNAASLRHAKIVGTAFLTYLIFEADGVLYIADQHAAHEMLLYKEIMQDFESGSVTVQNLLVPYVFTVAAVEAEFLSEHISVFTKHGFDLQSFGHNTFKINSVPAQLTHMNMQAFVDGILSDTDSVVPEPQFWHNFLARNACRTAVKAGDALNETEITKLKQRLAESDSLRCPHGRPVIVKLSKTEIEKWFNRIV